MTILFLLVLLAPASVACPGPAPVAETVHLEAGCAAPWTGRLFTVEAHAGVRLDFAALDAVAERLTAELNACQADARLDAQRCAADLQAAAAETHAQAVERPPDGASTPWPWLAGGAVAVAGPVLLADAYGWTRLETAGAVTTTLAVAAIVAAFSK